MNKGFHSDTVCGPSASTARKEVARVRILGFSGARTFLSASVRAPAWEADNNVQCR